MFLPHPIFLLQCLLTGLMFNKPADPIRYLQSCLTQIEEQSLAQVKWDFFLQATKNKTKLPPIKAETILSRESSCILSGGKISMSCWRPALCTSWHNANSKTFSLSSAGPETPHQSSPLPPISSQPTTESTRLQVTPDCAFILLLGGPGTSKGLFGPNLSRGWSGFVHISMSAAFRRHISRKGTAETRWKMADALINRGELAPEVRRKEAVTRADVKFDFVAFYALFFPDLFIESFIHPDDV